MNFTPEMLARQWLMGQRGPLPPQATDLARINEISAEIQALERERAEIYRNLYEG